MENIIDIVNSDFFANTPYVVFVSRNDINWNVEAVSDNVTSLLGYQKEDFTSNKIVYSNLIHPSDINQVAHEIREACANKHKSVTLTPYRLKVLNGNYIWVSDCANAIFDKNGEITHFVCHVSDITESQELLQKHKNSLDCQKTILNSIDFLVWAKDSEGRFLTVNKAFVIAANKDSEEDVIGKTDFELWPDDLAKKYRYDDDMVMKSRESKTVVEEVFDGNERKWFSTYKTPIFDDDKVIGTFGYAIDLTAEREIHSQLNFEKSQLETLIRSIPDLIWMKDIDGKYVRCNKRFEDFFGAAQEAIVGKTDYDFVPKELADFFVEHDQKAMNSQTPLMNYEKIAFASDGHEEYLQTIKARVADADGHILGVVGIARDVTKDKEQEELKNLLLESLADGVYGVNLDGVCTFINSSALDMIGFSEEEVVGFNQHSLFCNRHLDGAAYTVEDCPVGKTLTDGQTRELEDAFIRKNGEFFYVHLTVAPIIKMDKISGAVVVFQDISEKKILQHKLDFFNQSFESFLYQTTDFIYFKDIDSRIIFCSQTLANITGHKDWHDMIGKHDREMFPSDTAKIYEAEEAPVFSDGIPLLNKIDPYYDDNGEMGYIMTNKWPLFDNDGKVSGIFGISRDISERVNLENKLNKLNEELLDRVILETQKRVEQERLLIQQSKMATMGEMIGAIAHQWRQPLNYLAVIVQDVEVAYKFGDINDQYISNFKRDSMNTIQSMSNTIEDFRKFFSPNKKAEDFFVEDAISESLKILESQLKIHSVEIMFNNDPTKNHEYSGYKNELKQVLLNILSNAKDAIFEKNPTNPFIKIDVNTTPDNRLEITIEDSAGGIPEEIIGRIFEPYFTTKSDDKGTGIGLHMSKQIIEESFHGKLSVFNTDNGARFVVKL